MARPKKQTVEYFPHFVNHQKTMFVLENKYGNDGYAFWFKLLEILGAANGMYYNCNNVPEWEFLLAKTRLNDETVNNILNTLADLDAIDIDLWYKRKIIWVQNLVDNVTDAFKRRISEMPKKPLLHTETHDKEDLCIQKPSEIDETVNKNGESKVKESKVKESKEEEIKEDNNVSATETISKIDFNDVIKSFNSNIHLVTPFESEQLQDWLNDVEPEVVILAIEQAVIYNKRSYGYIKAILNSWTSNNLKTKSDVEAYIRDRQDKKGQEQSKPLGKVSNFNNFEQRDYDFEDLERKLLGWDNPPDDG